MKKLNLLFCFLVFFSCKKEQNFAPFPTSSLLLSTIEYSTNNLNWTEDYTYNSDNQLIQVEDFGNAKKRYELSYDQAQLVEIKTYNLTNNQLVLRVELVYNEAAQLVETLNYSIFEGEEFLSVYEYEYNENGFPSKQTSYNQHNPSSTSVINYFWKNGNVEKTETYYDGNLDHEFFYKYDDAFNYTSFQLHNVNQFLTWNQNNITQSSYKDHSGLLDTYCNPCSTEYVYNALDYPTVVNFNSLIAHQLTYQ